MEQIWRGKNECECTRKVEVRTRKTFLAVGEGETQSIQACLLSLAWTVQGSVTGCRVLSHIMYLYSIQLPLVGAATGVSFLLQQSLVATNTCLSRQNTPFVATKACLSTTKVLSQQN